MKNTHLLSVLFIILFSVTACQSSGEGNANDGGLSLDEIAKKVQAGELEEAKNDLEMGYLISNPDDVTALVILGNVNESLDENAQAMQAYHKALQIDPERAEALTGMGILHRKQGNLEKAIEFYQAAIKSDPDYAQAYSSLLVIEILQNNYEKAIEYGEKAWRLDQEDPVIPANLSLAYHYAGLEKERDEYLHYAEDLGYPRIQTLKDIFSSEKDLFESEEEEE